MPRDGKAPLISVEQLADELGVSVRYVRRIIAERRIPYVKVGHLIRFQRDEVEGWVEANRVDALTGRG
jgi:excisionase family DNA binding protein